MRFDEYLEEYYGVTWSEWDESYSFSEGTGKQLYEEYMEYMEEN